MSGRSPGRRSRSPRQRRRRAPRQRPTRADLVRRFRSLYGAGPLHLLALLASFAIAGAAVVGWFQRPFELSAVLVWFVAAILAHDLVLLPLYSLLDRIAFARPRGGAAAEPAAPAPAPAPPVPAPPAPAPPAPATANRPPARRGEPVSPVSAAPYLRVPAILSGLLLLVFFPLIFQLGSGTFHAASGAAPSGYLARWLAATGVLFVASALAYALAVRRARGRRPAKPIGGSPPRR